MSVKYKTVYRVENKKRGIGPYNSKIGTTRAWSAMSHDLPDPHNDAGFIEPVVAGKDDVFGAPTKSTMREWIVEPRVLRSHSYLIRKYKVPADKVVASRIQCMFKKKDAQCVAEYDIVEFCKTKKGQK